MKKQMKDYNWLELSYSRGFVGKMFTKTQKKYLLTRRDGVTRNADGQIIRTVSIDTVYWLWGIPVWKSTKFINGTYKELLQLI